MQDGWRGTTKNHMHDTKKNAKKEIVKSKHSLLFLADKTALIIMFKKVYFRDLNTCQ